MIVKDTYEYAILQEVLKELKNSDTSVEELKAAVEAKRHAKEIREMKFTRSLAVVSMVATVGLLLFQGYTLTDSNRNDVLSNYQKVLEGKNQDLEKTQKTLSGSIAKMEKELSNLEQQNTTLKENVKKSSDIETQLAKLESQRDSLTSEVTRLNAAKDDGNSLKNLQLKFDEKQKALADNEIKLAGTLAELKQKEQGIAALEKEKSDLVEKFNPISDFVGGTVTHEDKTQLNTDSGRYEFHVSNIDQKKENFDLTVTLPDGKSTTVTNLYQDRYLFTYRGVGFLVQDADLSKISNKQVTAKVGVFIKEKMKLIY